VSTLSSVSESCEQSQSVSVAIDHRKGPRRRGDALYAAIFEATLDELTAVGYAELKMEHVANRARASKGSLYRRWSSRAELVAEAVRGLMAETIRDPDLMEIIRTRFVEPGVNVFLDVLRRGAVRGEVRPGALTTRIASVAPELLRQHFLAHRSPISDEVLIEIVDEVIMPLVRM
jgi:AcrR family transcriptional regulator